MMNYNGHTEYKMPPTLNKPYNLLYQPFNDSDTFNKLHYTTCHITALYDFLFVRYFDRIWKPKGVTEYKHEMTVIYNKSAFL